MAAFSGVAFIVLSGRSLRITNGLRKKKSVLSSYFLATLHSSVDIINCGVPLYGHIYMVQLCSSCAAYSVRNFCVAT